MQIMTVRLFTYLNSYDLLCPSQSAYCPCHSTEMAPLRMTNNTLLALDTCDVSVLTLLDLPFSFTFSTTDHHILFHRLQFLYNYGISGIVLSWFESYFTGRLRLWPLMARTEDQWDVFFSVPQGTVLGPTSVFSALHLSALWLKFSLRQPVFCRGHTATSVLSSWSDTRHCLDHADMHLWHKICMTQNKLNDDRTEAFLMKSNRTILPDAQPNSLHVGTSNILFMTCARNLGFMTSNFTTWQAHFSFCLHGNIRCSSSICQCPTAEALVRAFVLAKLDYCNSLQSGCPLDLLSRLQKVQSFAAKLVFKACKRDCVQPLLQALHWLLQRYYTTLL